MTDKDKRFDLTERTARFGEEIIEFVKKVPRNTITLPLIDQLVRAGTSVGANYCEADCAESRKDFVHKLSVCKKEAKEVKHWLRMVVRAVPELRPEARILWREANELNLIFAAIIRKTKSKVNS